MKCPRCHRSDLFTFSNPYNLNKVLIMPKGCPVCGQNFRPEIGFYWGALYVAYMLAVFSSGMIFLLYRFLLWDVFVKEEQNILFYIILNAILIIALAPVLVRLSRSIWINVAVGSDKKHFK